MLENRKRIWKKEFTEIQEHLDRDWVLLCCYNAHADSHIHHEMFRPLHLLDHLLKTSFMIFTNWIWQSICDLKVTEISYEMRRDVWWYMWQNKWLFLCVCEMSGGWIHTWLRSNDASPIFRWDRITATEVMCPCGGSSPGSSSLQFSKHSLVRFSLKNTSHQRRTV